MSITPYYPGNKIGWMEWNPHKEMGWGPGNVTSSRWWPECLEYPALQIGFFTFDGPTIELFPDGDAPSIFLDYDGDPDSNDVWAMTLHAEAASRPTTAYAIQKILEIITSETHHPDDFKAIFDYGMPEWVRKLY